MKRRNFLKRLAALLGLAVLSPLKLIPKPKPSPQTMFLDGHESDYLYFLNRDHIKLIRHPDPSMIGWISDFTWEAGEARWTENFRPPTEKL